LGQPDLEFGPPFGQRAIEEVIHHVQPACFVGLQLIDIAVFENAGSERQLLCGGVDQQRAFHELATIVAGEDAFTPKIKMFALKAFAVYDALVWRFIRAHFFAFSPSSTNNRGMFFDVIDWSEDQVLPLEE
jgi:hypothetical protein